MRKLLTVLGVISFLMVIGFSYLIQNNQIKVGTQVIKTRTEKDVLSFLNNQKYRVIEFNDSGYFKYKLTEEMVVKEPTSRIWSFKKSTKSYIGKRIEEHYAVVTDHPLQTKYPDNRINLVILKSEGEIIGGISYCDFNTICNLDGSTIK